MARGRMIGPRRMPKNWETKQKAAATRAQRAVEVAARRLEKKRNKRNACVKRCQASFNKKYYTAKERKQRRLDGLLPSQLD